MTEPLALLTATALGATAWYSAHLAGGALAFGTLILCNALDAAFTFIAGRHLFPDVPLTLLLVAFYVGGAVGGVLLPATVARVFFGFGSAVVAAATAVAVLLAVLVWKGSQHRQPG